MSGTVTVEQLDAVSREVCRLFAAGDRVAILSIVTATVATYNNYEVALIIAMAVSHMPPAARQTFIAFLTGLCGLLNSSAA
jgi:hypothetical protein